MISGDDGGDGRRPCLLSAIRGRGGELVGNWHYISVGLVDVQRG